MQDNEKSNNALIEKKSSLISKNITISGHRTSVRLEPEMWKAMMDIAKREGCTIHELCSLVHFRKGKSTSLTAAIRVFLMLYFKASSTESGHERAGHGDFENMKIRAGITPALKKSEGLQKQALDQRQNQNMQI